MAKKNGSTLGNGIIALGTPVFVHGVLVSGGLPLNRFHHWQVGAALIVLGLVLR